MPIWSKPPRIRPMPIECDDIPDAGMRGTGLSRDVSDNSVAMKTGSMSVSYIRFGRMIPGKKR